MAEETGYKAGSVVSVRWRQIKKKKLSLSGADTPDSAKKVGSRGPYSKKRKNHPEADEESEIDGELQEGSVRKSKTHAKKAAAPKPSRNSDSQKNHREIEKVEDDITPVKQEDIDAAFSSS